MNRGLEKSIELSLVGQYAVCMRLYVLSRSAHHFDCARAGLREVIALSLAGSATLRCFRGGLCDSPAGNGLSRTGFTETVLPV